MDLDRLINMTDNDDFNIDPAIAEAMGFSGFGTQPGKKRKFDANDAVVDPDVKGQASGKGANSLPLGIRKPPQPSATLGGNPTGATAEGATQDRTDESTLLQPSINGPEDSRATRPDLQALRHGVRNENGDMVYFLPSFLEDPWKDLTPQ